MESNVKMESEEMRYNEESNHVYIELDKIRLVVEDCEVVGWYAPEGVEASV